MQTALGKRKCTNPQELDSDASTSTDNSSHEHDLNLRNIFRKAFEKNFKPLTSSVNKAVIATERDETNDTRAESDFEGFQSEEEPSNRVEVVEHISTSKEGAVSKQETRAFMQSKPPAAETTLGHKPSLRSVEGAEDENEKLNLKHDLALRRLIAESHLLDAKKQKASNHRQRVLDVRLQSLGSKDSLLQQEKMPMSHRKGIALKAGKREERRRREARENGVILEKADRPRSIGSEHRVRSVGGPNVGRFKGGLLTLSKKDIADIQDTGRPRFKGKRGR